MKAATAAAGPVAELDAIRASLPAPQIAPGGRGSVSEGRSSKLLLLNCLAQPPPQVAIAFRHLHQQVNEFRVVQ